METNHKTGLATGLQCREQLILLTDVRSTNSLKQVRLIGCWVHFGEKDIPIPLEFQVAKLFLYLPASPLGLWSKICTLLQLHTNNTFKDVKASPMAI